MPVTYDTIERLWRAENAQGQIVGYYSSKAAALAALAPEAAQPAKRVLSRHWLSVETPLATLPNGATIIGTHDTDSSPHLTKLIATEGYMFCGEDGVISGEWAGADLEFTTAQLHALRALFAGEMIPQLVTTAQQWLGDTPLATCLPVIVPPARDPDEYTLDLLLKALEAPEA